MNLVRGRGCHFEKVSDFVKVSDLGKASDLGKVNNLGKASDFGKVSNLDEATYLSLSATVTCCCRTCNKRQNQLLVCFHLLLPISAGHLKLTWDTSYSIRKHAHER